MKRYIKSDSNTFSYVLSPNLKRWSVAEKQRSDEISHMIAHFNSLDDYYEMETEEVYSIDLEDYGILGYSGEAVIRKAWFVYTHGWDENDNTVTRGKRVTGTTCYIVGIDGEILDDNYLGYKTLSDAKHKLELELDYMKQSDDWYNNHRNNG